jgi:hypothetical protein
LATAETHRSNILRKLGLHSIAELVLYAVRNGIIHVQCPPELRIPNPKTERNRPAAPRGYADFPKPGNGQARIGPQEVN